MPVTIERLPDEPIIIVTISTPFTPEKDMPEMYAQLIPLFRTIGGKVTQIIDVQDLLDEPRGFGNMVTALSEASKGVEKARTSGLSAPPRIIIVGSGPLASIPAEAMAQEQYGGVKGDLCATLDEALTLARSQG